MKKIVALAVLCAALAGVHAVAAPKWIAVRGAEDASNSWYCFQKELEVTGELSSEAVVRVACDSKYWLWINGRLVVLEGAVKRGPNPWDTYFDTVDVAPYLSPGCNIVSVLVWYFGKDGFSHKSSGRGALLVDGGDVLPGLDSDSSWRGSAHPAYFTPEGDVPNYRLSESNIGFDARCDIDGWERICDHSWPAVEEVGREGDAPWGRLHHRVIPQWRDFGLKDYAVTSVRHGDVCDTLVAELPYNAQVMPYMEVEARAGCRIGIVTDNYAGGGALNMRAEYVTADGVRQYENKGWLNGHKVYYIYPRDVTVRKVMYRETGYDTDMAGSLNCDDDFFNRLWTKAVRTLYITMRDTYMDCPDRERAQWWGDVVNESGEAFYALSVSSHKLMKKGMYELIGWQRPDSTIHSPVPGNYDHELPGQMLASVGRYGFWNYYLNTGDLQPIRDLYDGVGRYLGVWRYGSDGTVLPRSGGWHWGDWGDNIDKTVLYNAWYYMALDGYRLMSLALGRDAVADSIAGDMRSLKDAFNRVFWTGKAYRDAGYAGETDDRVQALAVVAGLADGDKYDEIYRILQENEHASPYMEKYVAEALFMMGRGEYALDRLKRRFGPMVNNREYSTLFEGWGIGADGFGGGTVNHAWSGGGLTILSQYVCGVSPVEPGFRRWSVKPQPAGIGRAEVLVPTVAGDIKVAFVDGVTAFALDLDVPDGTEAEVVLPYDGAVTVNGKAVDGAVGVLQPGQWYLNVVK